MPLFKATVPGSDNGVYYFASEIDCQKSFELSWSKSGRIEFEPRANNEMWVLLVKTNQARTDKIRIGNYVKIDEVVILNEPTHF